MNDYGLTMHLNQASDFALRILMLLANKKDPMTVDEIAQQLLLVKSHTMKIVAKLVKAELLVSQRGRTGGVSLGKSPEHISVGDVVRTIETDFAIVECMRDGGSTCTYLPNCKLRGVMHDAYGAFQEVLDGQSLKSIISPPAS